MKSKYSSYEEIKRDLEIYKIEKELNFHRIFRSFDQIKEEFTPYKLITNTFGSVTSSVKSSGGIQALIISNILRFIFKKIRKN